MNSQEDEKEDGLKMESKNDGKNNCKESIIAESKSDDKAKEDPYQASVDKSIGDLFSDDFGGI